MSRKERKIWNLVRLCDCCGRKVVLLRLPGFGSKSDPRWTVLCYERTWDGNPYYVRGLHKRHPSKKYALYMREREDEETASEDPYFSLD